MIKPRSRVVVFRLTEDEYSVLKDTCSMRGARNLSDFTRSELLAVVQPDSNGGSMQKRFFAMEQKIGELHLVIAQLVELLHESLLQPAAQVPPPEAQE